MLPILFLSLQYIPTPQGTHIYPFLFHQHRSGKYSIHPRYNIVLHSPTYSVEEVSLTIRQLWKEFTVLEGMSALRTTVLLGYMFR